MTELYILRHCKSDWNGNQRDKERPLAKRGIKDAGRMGRWMKQNEYVPATILCSSAVRTRQTTQLVCEHLGCDEHNIRYLSELYLASSSTLLSIINENRDASGPIMLVGHNPGMDDIVSYLANRDIPLTDKGKLMTTGCLARFRLPPAEQEQHHQAELLSITRPSEI